MSYSVKHVFIEKDQVLVRSFIGSVVMKDIIYEWERDIQSGQVNTKLKGIVTDFTNCKNNAKIDDLKYIAEFYKQNLEIFKHVKLAVVMNTPNIAILLVFEDLYSEMSHRAFSTFNAAMEWASY